MNQNIPRAGRLSIFSQFVQWFGQGGHPGRWADLVGMSSAEAIERKVAHHNVGILQRGLKPLAYIRDMELEPYHSSPIRK